MSGRRAFEDNDMVVVVAECDCVCPRSDDDGQSRARYFIYFFVTLRANTSTGQQPYCGGVERSQV